jgi:hypothetical protein
MNIKSMIVNEYTVGGSLLLVGAGFFSTRFTDALSYELFSLPSGIPVLGGASVTVGRVVGLVPLSLGLAFLFGKIRPVTSRIPVVDKVIDIADNIVAEVSIPVASEVQGAETVDHINPTEVSAENDEEVVLEAETSAPAKMKWTDAVAKARKDLNVKGFTAIKKGTPLYDKAKSYMN